MNLMALISLGIIDINFCDTIFVHSISSYTMTMANNTTIISSIKLLILKQ